MTKSDKANRWNLRSCARHGHVTYEPTGPKNEALRANLSAMTNLGETWRCLRCGSFILGAPSGSGPASDAPVVLRGKALRQATILRLLAIERFIRGILMLAAAYGIYRFHADQATLQSTFDRYLPQLRNAGTQLHYNVDSSSIVGLIEKTLALKTHTLVLAIVFVIIYGFIELTEGIGLWLMRRWGEYFAAVATAIFLPLEILELTRHLSATKEVAFAINVIAVIYLIYSKRLFGVRGGKQAYERELQSESLLEVEASAKRAPSHA